MKRLLQQARQPIGQASRFLVLALGIFALCAPGMSGAQARDAAFVEPGGGAVAEDALKVEPKNDIDIGESVLGVTRRVGLFFTNQTGLPVKVENVAVNGDGNVSVEIASDDCSKQGSITPGSRCSIEVGVTPSSPGAWSAQLLLTHNGAGRIARARLSGKTSGSASSDKKDMGLSLSTKEASPVNFGDVEVGTGKAVRSALMVNDSAETIALYSIDVIEAGNGLQRLDQGCAIDMELKPGESCPVTLVWTPAHNGQISTDLIIRHSGRLGFAVVPIRGAAKGGAAVEVGAKNAPVAGVGALPSPPTADELARAATGHIPPVSSGALGGAAAPAASGRFYLIGTVGNRAVILKPDGTTTVASVDDEIDSGGQTAKLVKVSAKSAELVIDGKKKTLVLEAAPELKSRAAAARKDPLSALGGMREGSSSSDSSSSSSSSSAEGGK